jgi:hypothetical protein
MPLDLNWCEQGNALIELDGWTFAGIGRMVGSPSDLLVIVFETVGFDCAHW